MSLNELDQEDLAVISMLWLALINLGFRVLDLDLSEPGYIERCGPHTIYTFAVRLRDGEVFPEKAFCDLMDRLSAISTIVKPHCYGVSEYPAHAFRFDAVSGEGKTVALNNFHDVYVSVFT